MRGAFATIVSTARRVMSNVDALLLLGSPRGAEIQIERLGMASLAASALQQLTSMIRGISRRDYIDRGMAHSP